jgi:hypothetical protein
MVDQWEMDSKKKDRLEGSSRPYLD